MTYETKRKYQSILHKAKHKAQIAGMFLLIILLGAAAGKAEEEERKRKEEEKRRQAEELENCIKLIFNGINQLRSNSQ